MTRKHALIVAIIAALAFAVVYFWPETARAGPAGSLGVAGRLHLGDSAVLSHQRSGADWRHGSHRRHDRFRGKHKRRGRGRGGRPVVIVPNPVFQDRVIVREERVILREEVVPVPVPAPPPPAARPPAPAPDPRGRARTIAVERPAPREWVPGQALPPDLPHVTLEPSAYDLPHPPAGQIYARVGQDVLRIEAGTRRIVAVLAR